MKPSIIFAFTLSLSSMILKAQSFIDPYKNHIGTPPQSVPTSGLLSYRLILSDYENLMVLIEDVYGRTVGKYKYNSTGNILRFSLENLMQGIYTLKAFKHHELIDSQRIVKVN